MWILLISALLKATFNSYSEKSFSNALSRVQDSTENEINGLNDWERLDFGMANAKTSINKMGSKRSENHLSACFSVHIFKL